MTIVTKILLFLLGTMFFVYVSRNALSDTRSHGFYRFFGWEGILLLLLTNVEYWFDAPFSWHQMVSNFLLVTSLLLVVSGSITLHIKGGNNQSRRGNGLFDIEKTAVLVTQGVYHYIRHPLYCSLLCLAWGIFFKSIAALSFTLVCYSSLFIVWAAKVEEKENNDYFGEDYRCYMRKTKMFIPYVI